MISNSQSQESWDTVIKPVSGWFDFDLRDLWKYRDLIRLFVKRDFVVFYKQTILGPLWYLIQPLFTTVVFTVIFKRVANISTDGIPGFLFYLAGTVMWTYFANCLTKTSTTFTKNAGIFGKVYFPRLTIPVSVVIINIAQFVIQFALFLCFYFYFIYKGSLIKPTVYIYTLPLLVIQMALLGLGFGILISSLTTKYRDLKFLVQFGVQLWMYATPIVYPLSTISVKYQKYFMLNPMTSVVELFRLGFLGSGTVSRELIAVNWLITVVVLLAGLVMFSKIEKDFMDTV